MESRQIIGLVGLAMIIFGLFSPIFHIPVVGDVSYFQSLQNIESGIYAIILLIVFSLVAILLKAYWFFYLSGVGFLFTILYTFIYFMRKISELEELIDTGLPGTSLQGLEDFTIHSIQYQWGWALLIIGSVFIVVAGMEGRRKR